MIHVLLIIYHSPNETAPIRIWSAARDRKAAKVLKYNISAKT